MATIKPLTKYNPLVLLVVAAALVVAGYFIYTKTHAAQGAITRAGCDKAGGTITASHCLIGEKLVLDLID